MEEVNEWTEEAEKDFLAAEINFQQKLYEVLAFLSHQAAEKALKAVYIFKFKRLWKIHDLWEIGKKVKATENILRCCEKLNDHYLATRYPLKKEYTEEIAKEALKFSKKVVKWSEEKIKKLQK